MKSYSLILTVVFAASLLIPAGCQQKTATATKPDTKLTPSEQNVVQVPEEVEEQGPMLSTDVTVYEIKGPNVTSEKPPVIEKPVQKTDSIISWEKTLHDFGNLEPGGTYKCEFNFTVKGDSPLNVRKVQPCCGVIAHLKDKTKKKYNPGESGAVVVTLNRVRFKGKIEKRISFFSDDPAAKETVLTFTANFVQKVAVEPASFRLAFNMENAGATTIKLKSMDDQPFAITKFLTPQDTFTADFDPNQKATEFTLQPKVNIETLKKYPNGTIKILLTHPKCGLAEVTYTTILKFKTSPGSIILQQAEPNVPVEKELWVFNNYSEDFEIESVESQRGNIEVLSKQKVNKRFNLKIKITPPEPIGKRKFFMDTLMINFSDGDALRIICRGEYAKK
jgi:hypothetical protein